MNMNIVFVIISLLFNLFTGGGGTASSTPTTGQWNMSGFNPSSLFQMMYAFGGDVDMDKAFNQEYDYTYYLDDGYQSYGWSKGSYVRIHGNMNSGIIFDFNIKSSQHSQEVNVTTPIEGVTLVTSNYTSGDEGYSFSVGPINLQTALRLFQYAGYYMMSATSPAN